MIGIVVTGHIKFAEGMESALKAICGDLPQVEFVNFLAEQSPPELEKNLLEAAQRVDDGEGVIFLTDLLGGSPTNCCVRIIMQNENYDCVCGTNLSMALTAALERDEFTRKELAEALTQPEALQIKNMRGELKACSIVDGNIDCSDDGI